MTRILLTGATGQVGWELRRSLSPLGELITPTRSEFDLSQPGSLRKNIQEWQPDLIVNPAAYTNVDHAETEQQLAYKINADAPRMLAEEAERAQIPLIHYSTDYVFDGKTSIPYNENDIPNPINVYGESKLKGEIHVQQVCSKHLIIRTSWLYGQHGHNFVNTMRRLFRQKKELRIVNDQIGSPTWSRMIADTTAIMLGKILPASNADTAALGKWGIYHVTATGETSWYKFAESILAMEDLKETVKLLPVSTAEYNPAAKRPMYSVMDCTLLYSVFKLRLPDWHQSLKLMLK